MTPHNLAVVFGPTLIRAPANEDLITNQGQINVFMEFFISEYFNMFPEENLAEVAAAHREHEDDDEEDTGDHTDEELASDEGSYRFVFLQLRKAVNHCFPSLYTAVTQYRNFALLCFAMLCYALL